MRIASWVFVLCTLVGVIGIFLPCLELDVSIGKKGGASLYKLQADRRLARAFIIGYGHHKKAGKALVGALLPRTSGRMHDAVDDASDAMSTLDDVSEDDAKTAGKILVAVVGAFLALSVVAGAIVLRQVVGGEYRRPALIVAAVMTLLTTAIAVGMHSACGEVVFEANDEIGRQVLTVGSGAWVMPIATGLALLSAIALVALRSRRPVAARA